MPDAFYEPDGDRFRPTELTRGPWDPEAQHAGPPAALLGREVERLDTDRPMQVGGIRFDILRSVPLSPLSVDARVVRPGRSVELVDAELRDEEGPVMRAAAWRLRVDRIEISETGDDGTPSGPEGVTTGRTLPVELETGYHTAMEYRFVSGDFTVPGPAVVWMRMLHSLVAGEEPSPLVRVLIVADSGNGVSAALDWRRFLFINVDLSVHLHRMPAGEWICLDSVTRPEPDGVGQTDTTLFDERGRIGSAAQTLLVAERT
jgi:acyl-Coa thioesterase superfamily protein/acyl-CoA thioesterase superfamily protein